MRYAIVIEGVPGSYSAYVPDLPGCVMAAETTDEIIQEMPSLIEFHLEGLEADGLPIPEAVTQVEYVEVSPG